MTDEGGTVPLVAEGVDGGLAASPLLMMPIFGAAMVLAAVREAPAHFVEKARYQPSEHGMIIHARSDIEWAWRSIVDQYLGADDRG